MQNSHMTIAVACQCGQKFAAPDHLAGKTVKCPKCAQPLKIPAQSSAPKSGKPASHGKPASTSKAPAPSTAHEELFDEIGLTHRGEGMECPSCGHMLPHDAVLCVNCGYNFKLKRRLQTLGTAEPVMPNREPGKRMSEVEKLLVRAEDDLEHEPVEQTRGYGTRSSAWMLALVMILIAGGVIGGGVAFFQYMEGKAKEEEKESATP